MTLKFELNVKVQLHESCVHCILGHVCREQEVIPLNTEDDFQTKFVSYASKLAYV